jgi:hypothetical protein
MANGNLGGRIGFWRDSRPGVTAGKGALLGKNRPKTLKKTVGGR